ncbi:2OG-Fe(II)-dependent halogenase WelO5 family protein [Xenorhabdus bovienii]|uniref:Fe2OG dioxygenase domain-containing protein n=1 Tax=Xenorhabdus bovienii str. oregonense TaxID=1398202 RepID=A0A077P296_XENBV|nr:hypothetical protein [Xenorhabdus bovienii]CDH04808.1 conserved hypothetical protein [Xenorhabdus bovienii str. oregonense]
MMKQNTFIDMRDENEKIADNFSYIEVDRKDIDGDIISDLILNGERNGSVLYVIRNAFTPDVAQSLVDSFDAKLDETQGGNRPYDGYVNAAQIGATQFLLKGEEYVKGVTENNLNLVPVVNSLRDEEVESIFLTSFLEQVFIQKGIHFGPARLKGGYSSFISLRRWLDNGEMSLWPHDDYAQLSIAMQDNFEIAKTRRDVVSFNACVEAAKGGGMLKVWNYKPNENTRRRLGVEGKGYPYPLELLENIEALEVKLNQGDVYFLNASYLHGVTSVSEGKRFSAGRFIGHIGDHKIVYWT